MPLEVEISINGQHIETLYIGRTEKFRRNDVTHNYVIGSDDGRSAAFTHLYSDGARVCVQKGLNALAEEET